MSSEPYDVFVSYARVDQVWAQPLAQAIERASGGLDGGPWRVFLDLEELDGTDYWRSRLIGEVERCRAFLAVLSPAYMVSYNAERMCFQEYETAVHRELDGKRVLLQVLQGDATLRTTMGRRQYRDLRGVAAEAIERHPEFQKLLRDLQQIVGARGIQAAEPAASAARGAPVPASGSAMSAPARVLLGRLEALLASDDRPGILRDLASLEKLLPADHPELAAWKVLVDDWARSPSLAPSGRRSAMSSGQREGERWTEPESGIEFCWIPAGTFWMGSSQRKGQRGYDPDAYSDEEPGGEVTLTQGYWIGRFPVTNAQYRRYLQAGLGAEDPEYWGDPRFNADRQPVVGVSWDEAQAYCAWLSQHLAAGWMAGLPSEAQWERAARGTDGRKYPWGSAAPKAWHACFGKDREKGQPAAVGGRPAGASLAGCEDLAGNVWEWCLDAWHATNVGRASDPCRLGDLAPAVRVVRGGSWNVDPRRLRCADRNGGDSGNRGRALGFRVVCRSSREHEALGL